MTARPAAIGSRIAARLSWSTWSPDQGSGPTRRCGRRLLALALLLVLRGLGLRGQRSRQSTRISTIKRDAASTILTSSIRVISIDASKDAAKLVRPSPLMRLRWRSACSVMCWWRSPGLQTRPIDCSSTGVHLQRMRRAIVDYLHALGISDCYASSYLAAVPGSPHGYDVADPTTLNPEIGTDADYWNWIDALSARHMGHILDLVPNHMGIAKSANPWWQDVLENGPSSRFAHFFDIEWHPVKDELADKLLIPILGDQYGAVLERQELRLAYEHGAFIVRCYDNVLPIAPDTFSTIFGVHLDAWLAEHAGDADADELQSILTSSRNLPSRSSREPDDIATRAREKEIVKRRLAALDGRQRRRPRARSTRASRHFNGVAGQPRSFDDLDRLAQPAVVSARALACRVRGNQLPALLRRQPARGAADGRPGGLRRSASLRPRARPSRRGDRPSRGSRRRAVRARRIPAAAAGPAARITATIPSSSSSKRFSAPANSCRPTGRSRARPATSSPRSSTTCSWTGATSGRSTTSPRGSSRSARAALLRRSRVSQQEAGHARDDVGRHQLARPSAQSAFPSATGTSAISRSTA